MPFYFFFGLLGLVVGGLVTWFLLADHPFESHEVLGGPVDGAEAPWLAERMKAEGMPVDEAAIIRVLELHGQYVEGESPESEDEAAAPVGEIQGS
jgi:hypothetical protein